MLLKGAIMTTRTEKILAVLKILALMGAIKFSIDCGSQLTSFVASFINDSWASRTYRVNLDIFSIRKQSVWFTHTACA